MQEKGVIGCNCRQFFFAKNQTIGMRRNVPKKEPSRDHHVCRISKNKIRRGPKLEGCAFANFENSSGTEGESRQYFF